MTRNTTVTDRSRPMPPMRTGGQQAPHRREHRLGDGEQHRADGRPWPRRSEGGNQLRTMRPSRQSRNSWSRTATRDHMAGRAQSSP